MRTITHLRANNDWTLDLTFDGIVMAREGEVKERRIDGGHGFL